jgi:putative two-component system response regulator
MHLDIPQMPAAIACLSRAQACRDFGTSAHADRVAMLITRLAREIGLSDVESRRIGSVAVLHDIGKLAVPMELLQKSTPLSPAEFALIKVHAQTGHEILSTPGDTLMTLAAEIALHHHEKYDGSGYPCGLAGEDIPLPAQIAAICDTYDALRQDRPYRRGLSHDQTMQVIVNGDQRSKPTHFAPRIWNAFQKISPHARLIFDDHHGVAAVPAGTA